MNDEDDITLEEESEDPSTDSGQAAEQKIKQLRDKLKKSQAENAENLAGWQRAKADYVNLQKRMREADSAVQRAGIGATLKELIPVFDSLEAGGQEAILKQLDSTLVRLNVTRHRPEPGDLFDPQREEAVAIVACTKKEEDNTIHSVMQSGYELSGTVIRPARVSVNHIQ